MAGITQEPGTFLARSESSISDGLATGSMPFSCISNSPSSFTEPKRFFTARRIL